MSPQEKLREAAKLVREVISGLEVESKSCTCCERITYPNWPAKLVQDKLSTISARLLDVAAVDRQAFMTIKELFEQGEAFDQKLREQAWGFRSAH